ncbi:MAG: guanylate kinase [Bacteroidetes bacterium]|nr:guanylate kinase [Bacteroidota bacterium]
MADGKLIIFSAPSGAGKTTIVKQLLAHFPQLEFSVSATSRAMREGEINGKDYYFIAADDFREKIAKNEFLEWEEVYKNQYYGTLNSELQRIWAKGHQVIFDVDVVGGLNIKNAYPEKSLAVFVMPPSFEVLKERLTKRSTESEESLKKRLEKAQWELNFADKFDVILINDKLEESVRKAVDLVGDFLKVEGRREKAEGRRENSIYQAFKLKFKTLII